MTGACPRSRVYRPGISSEARDRAMANMLDNIESDEGELINMLKNGNPQKRARV